MIEFQLYIVQHYPWLVVLLYIAHVIFGVYIVGKAYDNAGKDDD